MLDIRRTNVGVKYTVNNMPLNSIDVWSDLGDHVRSSLTAAAQVYGVVKKAYGMNAFIRLDKSGSHVAALKKSLMLWTGTVHGEIREAAMCL